MRRHSKIHGEEAQGLIEFALIAGILMLLFLGTIDYGRFMYYDTSIRNAARIGAELADGTCEPGDCGRLNMTTVNGFIFQGTICEPQPYVSLQPNPGGTFCTNCVTTSCVLGTNPCVSGGTNICDSSGNYCTKDVCVIRTNPTLNPASTPKEGQTVTVVVGYRFVPIAPLVQSFFNKQKCYTTTSDTSAGNAVVGAAVVDTQYSTSTPHTLCAAASGRVY